jgi:hypothetical protein
MRLGRLARKAKETVDKRGGTDSLKEDASELREVSKGKGSLKDKAKAAGKAIKEPGAGEQRGADSPAVDRPAEERPPPGS